MTDKQIPAKRAARNKRVSRNIGNGASALSGDSGAGMVVRDAIGRSLQAHFDDIANTPVPDKFLVLLAELEAREARGEN